MKKIFRCVCLFLTMSILFCTSAVAYTNTEVLEADEMVALHMSTEMLVKEIEAIKKEFPEAQLNTSAAIRFADEMSQLSEKEQIAFYEGLKKSGPMQTIKKVNEDGSYSILNVYAPMVASEETFTPGSTSVEGGVTYYTGSRVDVKNLEGFWLLNVHYSVDHYKTPHDTGYATNIYSFSGNGNGLVTLGSSYRDQPSGTRVCYRVELYTSGVGIGDGPAYLADIEIAFNASTFEITTAWV